MVTLLERLYFVLARGLSPLAARDGSLRIVCYAERVLAANEALHGFRVSETVQGSFAEFLFKLMEHICKLWIDIGRWGWNNAFAAPNCQRRQDSKVLLSAAGSHRSGRHAGKPSVKLF